MTNIQLPMDRSHSVSRLIYLQCLLLVMALTCYIFGVAHAMPQRPGICTEEKKIIEELRLNNIANKRHGRKHSLRRV